MACKVEGRIFLTVCLNVESRNAVARFFKSTLARNFQFEPRRRPVQISHTVDSSLRVEASLPPVINILGLRGIPVSSSVREP